MNITALKPIVCQIFEPIKSVLNHSGEDVKSVSEPPVLFTKLFTTPFAEKKTVIILTITTLDIKYGA